MKFSNGDTYEGQFLEGQPHGRGKYVVSQWEGDYEGEWKEGMREGQGEENWLSGVGYKG